MYAEISRVLQSSPEFVRVHKNIGKREVDNMPDIIVDNLEISIVIGLVLMYSVLSDVVHVMIQKTQSCLKKRTLYWVIQENLIESPLQSNLPYIPIQMVYASYCAPYPK